MPKPPLRRQSLAPLALAVGLALTALAASTEARACSCIQYGWGEFQGVPELDVVFRGTVREVRVPWSLQKLIEASSDEERGAYARLAYWSGASVKAVLEVEEAWRGVETELVELDVGDGGCCDCSFGERFPGPGSELLVLTNEHEGVLHMSTCAPPIPIAEAGQALEAFGPGRTEFRPGVTGRRTSVPWVVEHRGLALLGASLLALSIPLVVLLGRRREERS